MVQKKRGRPLGFDKDEALERAVEVFWRKGYEGASVSDLTEVMGISRPSLYAAFGDKRGLFFAALDAYEREIGEAPIRAFEAEPELDAALRAFFATALDLSTRTGDAPRGCLIASCARPAAPRVDGLAGRLGEIDDGLVGRVAGRFERAKAAGTLPEAFASEKAARLAVDLVYAQAARARIGETRARLAADIPHRVAAILG